MSIVKARSCIINARTTVAFEFRRNDMNIRNWISKE